MDTELCEGVIDDMIHNFLGEVSFNPNTKNIDFMGGDMTPDDLDYKENLPQSYLEKVLPKWQKSLVFVDILERPTPVVHLEINNTTGFNRDCRSHRGDDLPEDVPIPDHISNAPKIPKGYHFSEYSVGKDEIKKHNYVLSLDRESYRPFWTKECPDGVTWGDVMEGVMRVKGSKFDLWYELFCGAEVSFPIAGTRSLRLGAGTSTPTFPSPDTLQLDLRFDHGS